MIDPIADGQYETTNCLTEIVKIDAGRSLGGIPIQPTRSLAEAKQRYRTSPIPSRLPAGTYFLIAHDSEIALLEPIRFNVPWRAHVYWIAETKQLLPMPREIYSDDLPIAVDRDLNRPCVHHKPPPYFAKLWRYLDFKRFKDLLKRGGLFLARADRFPDEREGSLSPANLCYRSRVYKDKPRMAESYNRYCEELRNIRRHTYVSCWRTDEKEDRQSWETYTSSSNSVVIRTIYEKLRRRTQTLFCASIEYIDFDETWVPEGNSRWPFMYKCRRFDWEREFRVIHQQFPRKELLFGSAPYFDCSQENENIGPILCVNLKQFIDQIITAPSASNEFYQQVKGLAEEYGLGGRVFRSSFNA